jgi:DNA-binding response OmpR family regulator
MAISREPFPEATRADKTAAVLTVSSLAATHDRFREILQRRNQPILQAFRVEEAREFIGSGRVFLVITDRVLPDGTWRDVMRLADREDARRPLVIVTCRNADELLWGEVLNLGGYDVLSQPIEEPEVARITGMAWLQWKQAGRRASGAAGGWAVRAVSA